MKWTIDRKLSAPVAALPRQERNIACEWDISLQLQIDSGTGQENPLLTEMNQRFSSLFPGNHFQIAMRSENWNRLPKGIWAKQLQEVSDADLAEVLWGELLTQLRILPTQKKNRSRSYLTGRDANKNHDKIICQALAFQLLDFKSRTFNKDNKIFSRWFESLENVVRDRRPLERTPNTDSELIQQGFLLLKAISDLRLTPDNALTSSKLTAWPIAFQIAYIGEQIYLQTENGDISQAEKLAVHQQQMAKKLQKMLPGISSDISRGLWLHHLGRIHYYKGEFPQALRLFAAEWQAHQQSEEEAIGILQRSISSLLTDLGYLSDAKKYIQTTIAEQKLNDDASVFKSQGRLAELEMRIGNLESASVALNDSLHFQQQENLKTTQTRTYLGHLELLRENHAAAEQNYNTAEVPTNGRNPYLLMGKMALASRQNDTHSVNELWTKHSDSLKKSGKEVLPCAVSAVIAWQQQLIETNELQTWLDAMQQEYYLIEMLPILTSVYESPAMVSKQLQEISDQLLQWQQAIDANDWLEMKNKLSGIYPVNLAKTAL
jgi:hypothetical protein